MKKTEILIFALALAFICFTVGFFLGRNNGNSEVVIETQLAATPEARVESDGAADGNTALTDTASEGTDEAVEPAAAWPININTATAEELESLPDIGPVLAQRIVEYRSENGSFTSVDDILNVNGIGEETFNNLKDKITT